MPQGAYGVESQENKSCYQDEYKYENCGKSIGRDYVYEGGEGDKSGNSYK